MNMQIPKITRFLKNSCEKRENYLLIKTEPKCQRAIVMDVTTQNKEYNQALDPTKEYMSHCPDQQIE